ncbi:MAG TPA: hypothetical protein VIV11_12405 [Kofleriaceae bacterium]
MKRLALVMLIACGSSDTDGEGVPGPQGDPGEVGPQGPAGPQGPIGPAGPQGLAGADGVAGALGPMGPMGPMGLQGPAGPMGPMGATGATGMMGMPGVQGPAGPQGNPGPQGPTGPAGNGAYSEDVAAFAGFTAAKYDGSAGGRDAMHARCATEFAGAHLCHAAEYIATNSPTLVPASGAWLDPSVLPYSLSFDASLTFEGGPGTGRWTGSYTCSSWTNNSSSSFSSTYLAASGQITTASSGTAPLPPGCNVQRSLACCNGAPKVQFAGFSSMITNGGSIAGGRPGMHGVCAAEFAGAHMCHAAEYLRATSGVTIPTSGAWLDPSVSERDEMVLDGSPRFGRWTSSYTCTGWTNPSGTSFSSTFLDVDGDIKTHSSGTAPLPIGCAAQRAIACCR